MNYTAIFSFTKYILFSRHRRGHGIHSPFLFNLVSKVFRNKIDPAIVFNIESIRKELLSSKGSIYVNDLGAGPAKKKSNLRKVSDIARYSSVPPKYGKLLSNLSSEYGKPVILELGTSLGISTLYLASSSTDVTVHTIEGCTATAEIATANFRKAGVTNIKLHNKPFDEIVPVLKHEIPAPGLVFIDGNHRREALVRYCRDIAGFAGENTVIVIDDIHLSGEMESAWKEVVKMEKVTMAIDIHRMGLLFFRKGLNRLFYTIRY